MKQMAWKLMTKSIAKQEKSWFYNWSEGSKTRIVEVINQDKHGREFTVLRITANTENECLEEFDGQITDGYFENYRGDIRGCEIDPDFGTFEEVGVHTKFRRISG